MLRPKREASISLKFARAPAGVALHVARAREVDVVQAVDELVLRELVDVLLEGEVDEAALVGDEALLLDDADALAGHAVDAASARSPGA